MFVKRIAADIEYACVNKRKISIIIWEINPLQGSATAVLLNEEKEAWCVYTGMLRTNTSWSMADPGLLDR